MSSAAVTAVKTATPPKMRTFYARFDGPKIYGPKGEPCTFVNGRFTIEETEANKDLIAWIEGICKVPDQPVFSLTEVPVQFSDAKKLRDIGGLGGVGMQNSVTSQNILQASNS